MSPRPHTPGQPLNIPLRPDWPRVGAWPGRFPLITPNLMTGGCDGDVRGDNPGMTSGLNNVTVPATSFPFAGGPAPAGPHRGAHRDMTATSLAVSVRSTVGKPAPKGMGNRGVRGCQVLTSQQPSGKDGQNVTRMYDSAMDIPSAGPLEPLRLADVCAEMRRANCWSARDGSSGLIGLKAGSADELSSPIKGTQCLTEFGCAGRTFASIRSDIGGGGGILGKPMVSRNPRSQRCNYQEG